MNPSQQVSGNTPDSLHGNMFFCFIALFKDGAVKIQIQLSEWDHAFLAFNPIVLAIDFFFFMDNGEVPEKFRLLRIKNKHMK